MFEDAASRTFHCADCEVGWVAGPDCFCCGRTGAMGQLSPTIVAPSGRDGWAGPLSRPAAYRTAVRRASPAGTAGTLD